MVTDVYTARLPLRRGDGPRGAPDSGHALCHKRSVVGGAGWRHLVLRQHAQPGALRALTVGALHWTTDWVAQSLTWRRVDSQSERIKQTGA